MSRYEKEYVRNIYENISHFFNHTRTYQWSWIRDFITTHYKIGDIVFDVGCGNGRNMKKEFIGIDTCFNLTKICKDKKLNVLNSDICSLSMRDNIADIVICIAVFHHLYTIERREKALRELFRITHKNSIILLSVWSKTQPKKTRRVFEKYGDNMVLWKQGSQIYERFYYIFQIDEIKDLFDKCGFQIIAHTYDCGNEVFTLKHK